MQKTYNNKHAYAEDPEVIAFVDNRVKRLKKRLVLLSDQELKKFAHRTNVIEHRLVKVVGIDNLDPMWVLDVVEPEVLNAFIFVNIRHYATVSVRFDRIGKPII